MIVVEEHPSEYRHTQALKRALADIPDDCGWAVCFGDRPEQLRAALDLHYRGIKLVHVGGGDTPHGTDSHPDHRTRDAISMLARVHCVANHYAAKNLTRMLPDEIHRKGDGYEVWGPAKNVHITGSPGLDEVVAYAKTLDPERKRSGVFEWYPEAVTPDGVWTGLFAGHRLTHEGFLRAIAHCELFRTNSSAGLYEAPILGTPVELVGDRQAGRRGPYHHPEGRACAAIRKVVEDVCS